MAEPYSYNSFPVIGMLTTDLLFVSFVTDMGTDDYLFSEIIELGENYSINWHWALNFPEEFYSVNKKILYYDLRITKP